MAQMHSRSSRRSWTDAASGRNRGLARRRNINPPRVPGDQFAGHPRIHVLYPDTDPPVIGVGRDRRNEVGDFLQVVRIPDVESTYARQRCDKNADDRCLNDGTNSSFLLHAVKAAAPVAEAAVRGRQPRRGRRLSPAFGGDVGQERRVRLGSRAAVLRLRESVS